MNNLQEHFKDLHFVDETHTYTVEGLILPSVSGLIKQFYEPFNAKKIAPMYGKKHGMTTEEVLAKWDSIRDEAAAKGTRFHDWAELCAVDIRNGAKFDNLEPMQYCCYNFWRSLDPKYKIVALELRMYHEKFEYAGTADIILLNEETGKYVVVDYKTNKDLHKNYRGKLMSMPFQEMLDCPLSHYELQLSYYQMMLEAKGYEVEDRWVVHVNHKTNDDTIQYKVYKTEDHTKKLVEYHKHKELYDWLS